MAPDVAVTVPHGSYARDPDRVVAEAVNWPAWLPWLSVSASTPPDPPPTAPVPTRTLPDGSHV
jgi:hypothetical protein